MFWKKLGKALLFPKLFIMLLLVPIAVSFLAVSVTLFGAKSPITVTSYVISAYTLTVWGFRIPDIIRTLRSFKTENSFVIKWRSDERLRLNVSLYGTLIFNSIFAVFQLFLGIYNGSFWFYSLSAYYFLLAIMRFFLLRHTRSYGSAENMRAQLIKYSACGWILLFMNLALALIVFFMIYWSRTFVHHQIAVIALAAFTFTAMAVAITNLFKYKKYKSPVYSASQVISLAAALVSMLTLESTMLTAFGDVTDVLFRNLMIGLTGGGVSASIIFMAVYMIICGTKRLKKYKEENFNAGR